MLEVLKYNNCSPGFEFHQNEENKYGIFHVLPILYISVTITSFSLTFNYFIWLKGALLNLIILDRSNQLDLAF